MVLKMLFSLAWVLVRAWINIGKRIITAITRVIRWIHRKLTSRDDTQ